MQQKHEIKILEALVNQSQKNRIKTILNNYSDMPKNGRSSKIQEHFDYICQQKQNI
jgi:ribosomal protein S20